MFLISFMKISRRAFLSIPLVIAAAGSETSAQDLESRIRPPSPEYEHIHYNKARWLEFADGLSFVRFDLWRGKEKVDHVAVVKMNPARNRVKVLTSYRGPGNYRLLTVPQWQEQTGAPVVFNSAQYEANPYGQPCGLIMAEGRLVGPRADKRVRGMLVSDPLKKGLPLADLLDFQYDAFDHASPRYAEGVQHWPILLDRTGKVRVKATDWQANRTVVAKDRQGDILVFVTEGGFFTLYNFGRFLRESEFGIVTAMNLDGGYEAQLAIDTKRLRYKSYGQFETYGVERNASIKDARIGIPTALAFVPR